MKCSRERRDAPGVAARKKDAHSLCLRLRVVGATAVNGRGDTVQVNKAVVACVAVKVVDHVALRDGAHVDHPHQAVQADAEA